MSDIDFLLNMHTAVTKQLHEAFEYEQQIAILPIDDCREYHWRLLQEEDGTGVVQFADNMTDMCLPGENYWQFRIYTQRQLPKHVYRTDAYTMVVVETQCESPSYKALQIFNNFLEIT